MGALRFILLAAVLAITLGGCEALKGLTHGAYGGGDIGFHQEIH